jgi:hypothetical protein
VAGVAFAYAGSAVPDPEQAPPRDSSRWPIWLLLVIICGGAVPVLGIMASLAIYGVRKYLVQAKTAEGRVMVEELARDMAECARSSGSLPASSRPVPASFASVQGMKYLSAPAEWSGDPAFACAHFSISTPQYFQYQWQLETSSSGVAVALADLDGDGAADVSLRVPVSCAGATCKLGMLETR